jgi:hypothetical protein
MSVDERGELVGPPRFQRAEFGVVGDGEGEHGCLRIAYQTFVM